MNPEIKARWVAALRLGEYKQARGRLRKGDGFCCLGVLCDLHSQEKGKKWSLTGFYLNRSAYLPQEVEDWADLPSTQTSKGLLGRLNDEGMPFHEIADLIDKEF